MKSATIFGLISSIQFVISSTKIWKCELNVDVFNDLIFVFDCACSNDCQEIIYNADGFECGSVNKTFERIEWYRFRNCNLSQINSLQIEKFTSPYIHVIIYKNVIHHIDHEILNNENNNVISLEARSNNISTINKNAFKHLKKLNLLSLSENDIETIEDDLFVGLSELWSLKLSENKLVSINETTFFGLNKLKFLFLENNNINFIHKNAFNNLTNLRQLRLRSNSITQLEVDTFAKLTELMWLDLSENALETFNFELISPMNETFQVLHIDDNHLTELKISTNLDFPLMWWLRIARNRFNCCKLQSFFNSTEGKRLTKKEIDLDKVLCDGDRQVDQNGNIPNFVCAEDSFNPTEETTIKSNGLTSEDKTFESSTEIMINVTDRN